MKKTIKNLKINTIGINYKDLQKQINEVLCKYNDAEIIAAALSTKTDTSQGKLTKLIFTDDNAKRIDSLLLTPGINISNLVHGLLDLMSRTEPERSQMSVWLSSSGRTPREGQDQFYLNLVDSLNNHKIGFCEASTGAGKTAAILAALFDVIKNTGKRGLISTPAVSLVRDFAIEHERLGINAPPLRVFFGMSEFVSQQDLDDFLNNWTDHDEQRDKIRAWVENGAPSCEQGITHAFLKHSLKLIAPDMPLEEVLLNQYSDAEDEGMLAYRKQFNKDNDKPGTEEILLCSQAMLAVDIRTRLGVAVKNEEFADSRANVDNAWKVIKANKAAKISTETALDELNIARQALTDIVIESSTDQGRLPDYGFAVIDEAHLLESSFSNTLSNYVAVHQFTLQAKELASSKVITKEAYSGIQKAYYELCAAAKAQDNDTIHISQLNESILSPLAAIEAIAREGLKKFSGKKKRAENLSAETKQTLFRFQLDVNLIGQASRSMAGQVSYLNLSPRLAYPRLFVGRSSVDRYLRLLWDMLDGAACVSATLYTPKADAMSSIYMQSILAVPNERKQDFEPVKPLWIREAVASTHIPVCNDLSSTYLRTPPRQKRLNADDETADANELRWCSEVADELTKIYDSAAGGCLVLMTSYSTVKKVKDFLMENKRISPNLVFAQQGELATKKNEKKQALTIDEQRRSYLKLALDGKKPIWLALGNSWTGINLSGGDAMKAVFGVEIPAEEDNVLTDLIIPRLPFGINKSITHTYRVLHRKKIPWELIDTLLRLRQGIGRLVRRQGVPKNRRIHILDARLCDDSLKSMMPSVKKALE
jgi:CRISPR type IV-associated DEAD/DEAH-box helicase Csf4